MKRSVPGISQWMTPAGKVLLVAVVMTFPTSLFSQGIGRAAFLFNIGLQFEKDLLTGTGIPRFPGSGDCGVFDHATATAKRFTLGCELPNLLAYRFGLAPALSWRWGTADYSFEPSDFSLFNPIDHTYDSISHEYHLDMQYRSLTLALSGNYRPNDLWGISFGPEVEFRFSDKPQQSLVITADTTRLPEGARRQELYRRNDLTVQPVGFNLVLGASASVPLGNGLCWSIDLYGRAEFISLLREAAQFGLSAGAGLSLDYDILPAHGTDIAPPEVTERHVTDTVPQPQPVNAPRALAAPGASIQAFAIDADREPQRSATLHVFETVHSLYWEPVALIDFPRGSGALPEEYMWRDRSASFTLDSVPSMSADELRRQQINIIGARMVADTTLQIELAGSVGRGEATGLAAVRSRAVQEYLLSVWKIDPSRIRLRTSVRSETQLLADEGVKGGVVIAGDERIRAPLVIQHTERSVEPPTIMLDPTYQAEAGVRSWRVEFRYGTQVLGTYGSTRPGAPSRLDWNLTGRSLEEVHRPLVVEFTLEDSLGHIAVARDSVPIEIRRSARLVFRRISEGAAPTAVYTLFDRTSERSAGGDRQRSVVQEIARSANPGTRLAVLYCVDSSAGCTSEQETANRAQAENVAMKLRTALAEQGKRGIPVDVRAAPALSDYIDPSASDDYTSYDITILVTQGDKP